MPYNTLLYWTPGPIEVLIVLLVWGGIIAGIVMLVRYILGNRRDNIRMRLEVGKLADELEHTRKQDEGRDQASQ